MVDIANVIPLNGQVLVKDDKKEEKVGSIFLADTADQNPIVQGKILRASRFLLENGMYMDPDFHVGDIAIYSKHAGAGNVIIEDDQKTVYRLIRFTEILGIVG